MGRRSFLGQLERQVIQEFALLSGYSSARITELVCPYFGGGEERGSQERLEILQKRIDRLLCADAETEGVANKEAKRDAKSAPVAETIAGSYVLHAIRATHGEVQSYLLCIFERHTGMIAIAPLSRITPPILRRALKIVVRKFQQPCLKLTLLVYPKRRAVQKTKRDDDAREGQSQPMLATVIRKPVDELIARKGAWLGSRTPEIVTLRVQPPEEREPLVLSKMDRSELNERLIDLIDGFNQAQRATFPRNRERVVPLDRLFFALKKSSLKSKKKSLTFNEVRDMASFDKPVAENDRYIIIGGRPKSV